MQESWYVTPWRILVTDSNRAHCSWIRAPDYEMDKQSQIKSVFMFKGFCVSCINPFEPEFTIVIFIYYKLRILDL